MKSAPGGCILSIVLDKLFCIAFQGIFREILSYIKSFYISSKSHLSLKSREFLRMRKFIDSMSYGNGLIYLVSIVVVLASKRPGGHIEEIYSRNV